VLCFVDESTMVFGAKDAVTKALDARDGVQPSMLTNKQHDGRDEDGGHCRAFGAFWTKRAPRP